MKRITQCRACGSSSLTPAFSIDISGSAGKPAVFDAVRGAKKPTRQRGQGRGQSRSHQARGAGDYVLCDLASDQNACGLLQRANVSAPPAGRPPSGAFRSTRGHLRAAATEALELVSGRDCSALDIGCSDGSLLSFYPRWVKRCGVDENDVVRDVGAWASTAQGPFPSAAFNDVFGDAKFDIITAISVLEDMDDPRAFLREAAARLSDDGVMVIETLYAPMTLTRVGVEAIFEQRAAIYSLGALEQLFRTAGLKIFRGGLTDKNGGSVRLFVCRADVDEYDFDPWYERLARLWDEENALALHMPAPYQAFEHRAGAARDALGALMQKIRDDGEAAHLVGAGAVARGLYAWSGAGAAAVEAAISFGRMNSVAGAEGKADALAEARLCAGGPPVIGEAEARALDADCFIAPAAWKRDLLEQWRDRIMRGVKLVFATPEPHIVDSANYSAELAKTLAGGDKTGGVEGLRAILQAAGGPRLVSNRVEDAPDRKSTAAG